MYGLIHTNISLHTLLTRDNELLSKTGGVVQGMSGSTMIQGDYIIGAVNYVVVDNPKRGYGIFRFLDTNIPNKIVMSNILVPK